VPKRVFLAASLAIGLVALVCLAVLVLLAPTSPLAIFNPEPEVPDATWGPGAVAPVQAAVPGAGVAGLVDEDWLASTSAATGIPERALAAYAGVAIAKAQQMPQCELSWNTLAAVGYVESRHGTHDGSVVGADGTVTPGIFGIALDGTSTDHVPDSDEGVIDGDPDNDRAVGPMQLIPQTWRNWHVDANGDGVEDPQNIDDATLATANYLCRSTGSMANESGWRAGIAAYNSAAAYITAVANAATRYAR
jgi:membrane-bound lytic murein transglycosylase B